MSMTSKAHRYGAELTQLTLDTDMGTYWIATTTEGEKCFVHATEANNFPDVDTFSAIVTPNRRDHPPLYAKRISDILDIVPPDKLIEGYSDVFDFAYAAGLCGKIVFLDQSGDNRYFYAPNLSAVYVEEFE